MGNRVRELFDYKEGKLLWKVSTSNRVKVGDTAGSLTTNKYYMLGMMGYVGCFIVLSGTTLMVVAKVF